MGDKVRKLSDAIRLGSTFTIQTFRSLFGYECDNRDLGYLNADQPITITKTCALGAAVMAIDNGPGSIRDIVVKDYYEVLRERYPEMVDYCQCPECESIKGPMSAIITHLNDRHQWSREKIADWLEGLGL